MQPETNTVVSGSTQLGYGHNPVSVITLTGPDFLLYKMKALLSVKIVKIC